MSAPSLSKPKRSIFRLFGVVAMATSAFLLLANNSPDDPQGPAVLRANILQGATAEEADGSRQLARRWYKDKRSGKKTWRRNKWSWYIQQRKKHGREVKYVEDRPDWAPHPNKAKGGAAQIARDKAREKKEKVKYCEDLCGFGGDCAYETADMTYNIGCITALSGIGVIDKAACDLFGKGQYDISSFISNQSSRVSGGVLKATWCGELTPE